MAKKKQLRDQSIEELKAMHREIDRDIFSLRNELAMQRKLEKPHLIKAKRKERARVLTILTQKQKEAV